MVVPNAWNFASWLTVKQMMNTQFRVLHLNDTIRTVIELYQECKLNTLPVVDENENLIGVFPKKRLYKALLNGVGLDSPCKPYIVYNPIHITSDLTYDEVSLVVRITKSQVDYVVVVDQAGKVVGMIGAAEYLRESLNLILTSSALLESLFRANYEGIVIIDRDGYILRINPAAEKMFGMSLAAVKGLHLKEVLPEIVISEKRRIGLKQTVKSVPVIVNQAPILDKDVQIGTNITFMDITDVEKMAQELEMVKELQTTLSGVLGASSDGVFVSDTSGMVRYVNEAAGKLLAESTEDITGQPLQTYLQTNSLAQVAKSGAAEVDQCSIMGRNCIVSHIPIKKETAEKAETTGIVSTVYLDDNVLTEEIARKWFSLSQQVQYYRSELEKQSGETGSFEQLVSNNPKFNKMKRDAQRIARSSSTVLLTGESGVGKEVFARAIHGSSPRAKYPFLKINCAAIPETLLESELFGYAPGSFTGASKKGKPGYFEQANKGTIFMDEIGDMPLSIQVKMLQVLQEKEFMRVGGTSSLKVDVRIIAATNRDLREAIAKGFFREDLFYRLNVIEFNLPALRERTEDILLLAETFIKKYNRILGANVKGMKREVREALLQYSWPGNIRELENAIERAANYVWEGEIDVNDLPSQIFQVTPEPLDSSVYRSAVQDAQKEIILEALRKVNGNKSAAARLLNISRSAFYEKLKKYEESM